MTNSWTPQFKHEDVKILEEKLVYSGYCPIKQYKLQFRLFEGGWSIPVSRELIMRPKVAAVLLYDGDKDKVVFIEQMRVGVLADSKSPWVLDIVAGMVDEGESLIEAAHREALEEAGCKIKSLIPIHTYLVSVGISDEETTIYCGLIDAPEQGTLHGLHHDGEDIKVHVLSYDEALQIMKQGKLRAASAVIAFQWLMLHRDSLHGSR